MSPVAIPAPLDASQISRRPSPWHELAHSLSSTPPMQAGQSSSLTSIHPSDDIEPTPSPPQLSSSQALREWEARLSLPDPPVRRQHLSPRRASSTKLAAERDKEGHIEYKLKLIDPTPERFERLVTQMMWRLLQGRNEAIYEIGLADDGTVIGLTRAEMDASLRTLELMASEVGATVLVLKEIVLIGSTISPNVSLPASAFSLASNSSPRPCNSWCTSRPELSYGQPRKHKGRRTRRKQVSAPDGRGDINIEKRLSYGRTDLDIADLSTDTDDESLQHCSHSTTDEDVPPFHLDLEETSPSPATSKSSDTRQRRSRAPRLSDVDIALRDQKAEAKQVKSAVKREQRRMDLLRGDGKSSMFEPDGVYPIPLIPHQPSRPSSLRLATPASPEDGPMDHLLHLPLDSLSLSFAEIRTVTSDDAPSLSSSADTEFAVPMHGEDMICVEALVVRKGGFGEDDGWGFGGEEDGWGFGGEDDMDEFG